MSSESTSSFLDRLETDEAFAQQIADLREDPAAVQAAIAAAGFEVSPDEIREAFLERYGSTLNEEQLAAVAGGMDGVAIAAISVSAVGLAAAVGISAAAAAF